MRSGPSGTRWVAEGPGLGTEAVGEVGVLKLRWREGLNPWGSWSDSLVIRVVSFTPNFTAVLKEKLRHSSNFKFFLSRSQFDWAASNLADRRELHVQNERLL